MNNIILWALLIISIITLIEVTILFAKFKTSMINDYLSEFTKIETLLIRIESVLRTETSTMREEQSKRSTEFERAIIHKLSQISNTQQQHLDDVPSSVEFLILNIAPNIFRYDQFTLFGLPKYHQFAF